MPLYTDWIYIYETAIKSPNTNYSGNISPFKFDFSLLTSFQSFNALKYWYTKVKITFLLQTVSIDWRFQFSML